MHASDRDTILSAYIEYAPWLKEKLVIAIDDKELIHCLESMINFGDCAKNVRQRDFQERASCSGMFSC